MIPNIDKQIEDLGVERIKAIQERFTVGDIVPYEYQCVAYVEIAKRLSRYEHPFLLRLLYRLAKQSSLLWLPLSVKGWD